MRNILDAASKSQKDVVYLKVRVILDAPDTKTARRLLQDTLQEFEGKANKAMDVLEDGFDVATAVLSYPENTVRDFLPQTVLSALTRKFVVESV